MRAEPLSRPGVALGFLAAAAAALPFADFGLAGHDPWAALGRMGAGFLAPDFGAIDKIGQALLLTLAFAVAGAALGGVAGLVLAPFHHLRLVRWPAIALRSVHELFWALFLIQIFGIGPLAGVLAIALPYAGICAKVFAEIVDEADQRPARTLAPGTDAVSRFLWARAPLAARPIWAYWLYRLECALRASAVLGFVGLPTLGFQLDAFFKIGNYGAVSAIILTYVALIASLRLWARPLLVPLWVLASGAVLAALQAPPMGAGALLRFFTVDLVPAPLRSGGGPDALWTWLGDLLRSEMLPGLAVTLVVGQIALALSGLLAFLWTPLLLKSVSGTAGRRIADLAMILLRSFPEYMLAYLFLQALGPSMLPAVLALGLHNAAILAHLTSREGNALAARLRPDAPGGLTLWGWELAPRLFGPFLALSLYRWESILRETAVMGLLGILTLGFYVDSALEEMRVDRALILLLGAGLLTAGADAISRHLRRRLGAARLRGPEGENC